MKKIPQNNYSDQELLEIYKKTRDSQITGILYNRYYPDIFQYCLYLLRDPQEAFDQTQNIFLKAMERINQLKELESFGPWIRKITLNVCINFLKEKKRKSKKQEDLKYYLQTHFKEDPTAENRLPTSMEDALLNLPTKTVEILVLKYIENQSIHDLQNIYNISESAVKMRLARARKKALNQFWKRASA